MTRTGLARALSKLGFCSRSQAVKAIQSGKVTLNGAPIPTDAKLDGQSRGRLRFRNVETFDDYDVDFGENGPVTYTQKVFAGAFDVYVHGNYETVQSVFPGAKDQRLLKGCVTK